MDIIITILAAIGSLLVAAPAEASTPACRGPVAVTTYNWATRSTDRLSCNVRPNQRFDIRVKVANYGDRPLIRAGRVLDRYGCQYMRIEDWRTPVGVIETLRGFDCDN